MLRLDNYEHRGYDKGGCSVTMGWRRLWRREGSLGH
jgi:hypothetical protein